jgi:hypothetical protein
VHGVVGPALVIKALEIGTLKDGQKMSLKNQLTPFISRYSKNLVYASPRQKSRSAISKLDQTGRTGA